MSDDERVVVQGCCIFLRRDEEIYDTAFYFIVYPAV